jgi:tRNA(fMet)-specific endonuclease VapC
VHLLDTNVCVDYLTGRYPSVVSRIHAVSPDELVVSAVVAAELRYGADKSAHPRRNHARVDALLAEIRCIGFDAEAARTFGRVRRRLEAAGTPIGPYDTMIAAHALSLRAVLVSDNVAEFSRVSGLRLENWRAP